MPRQASLGGFALDHVLVAGARLDPLAEWFAELGVPPDYGGIHGNGVTHNSVIGFDDGSYVELIALYDPETTAPRRDALLRADVGPCGWALETPEIERAAERLADAGVAVEGPVTLSRERPDGQRVAFDVVYVGAGDPGTSYPFLIRDRTPRERRIAPTEGVAGSELTGVGGVVQGVPDIDRWAEAYRSAFDLPDPRTGSSETLDADLAVFSGSALVLAEPRDGATPLGERVDRFGPLPCGHLLATQNFATSRGRGPGFERVEEPFDRRIGWYDGRDAPFDGRIGVVEVDAEGPDGTN